MISKKPDALESVGLETGGDLRDMQEIMVGGIAALTSTVPDHDEEAERMTEVTQHEHRLFAPLGWPATASFAIVSFVLAKMPGPLEGLLTLHRLRGARLVVLNSAKRGAAKRLPQFKKRSRSPLSRT